MQRPAGKKLEGVEWASGDAVQGMQSLGDESTIAQVHPKKLCDALWEATCQLTPSSKLVKGKVSGPSYNGDDLVGAKIVDGEVVPGRALLYACGPWTANIMTGVKYHSVVVPTPEVLSQCVFFSGMGDPEVYVRPDRTAYCTGFPDAEVSVTEEPGQEEVREDAVRRITSAVQQASNMEVDETRESIQQACYLPSTPDGLPMMGALADQAGCYVATGHTCWGILMGPASGEAMAHLIAKGKSPYVSLSAFDPGRMRGGLQMVPQARTSGVS